MRCASAFGGKKKLSQFLTCFCQLVVQVSLPPDPDRPNDVMGKEQAHHVTDVVGAHPQRSIMPNGSSLDRRRLHGEGQGLDDR